MEGNEALPDAPEDVFMENIPPQPHPQHPHATLPVNPPPPPSPPAQPLLLPPLPEYQQPEAQAPPTTIRAINMGFNTFCWNPLLREAIQEYVLLAHHLQVESCRLLVLYLLHTFENHPDPHYVPPIHRKGGGILRHFYAGIIASSSPNHPNGRNCLQNNLDLESFIRNEYIPHHRPLNLPWVNMQHLGQTVTTLANEHATVCMNHVVINLPKKINQYLQLLLFQRLHSICKRQTIIKLRNYAYKEILRLSGI